MPAMDQSEVLAFLERGTLGAARERIDTHAAIILLAGDRAFKLKRPVRYSFLDFTTLERRERALRHELELNRRTAPMLYRRVLPVTREADGGLALGGAGRPVEWLLEMARFPAEAELDRVAAAGPLAPELMDRLAEGVAELHAAAPRHPDKGGIAAMREVARGNVEDLTAATPEVFAPEAVQALAAATETLLTRTTALMEQRRAAGRVRHCHGDLHLGNIVLLDRRPVPFDCIEFDDDFACIDVLYDLAFLVMDLLQRGHAAEANRLLNGWLERTRDHAGLTLLPLFLSVRAVIRAKVIALAVLKGGEGEAAEARRYLAPGQSLLQPAPPCLVAIGGASGTGKTSVARRLAPGLHGPAPGAVVLRSDVIRKELFGRPATERLPVEAYAPAVSARVFATLAERAAETLAAGYSVIADAVYGTPEQRAAIEAVASTAGVPFAGFWLEAPMRVLVDRVDARTGDASDAGATVVRRQLATLDQASVRWRRIRADQPLDAVAAAVAQHLDHELAGAAVR
jgi:aminoglycoside phosphotransferase family enzyme/predicted kinase